MLFSPIIVNEDIRPPQVAKTNSGSGGSDDENGKYRQLLVRTLHQCTVRFPDQASKVIPVLMEFLSGK